MNRYQNHLAKCVPPVGGGGGVLSAVRASTGRALAGRRCAVVNSSGKAGRAVFVSGSAVHLAQVSGVPVLVRGASGCVSVSASVCRRPAFVASLPNKAFVWDRAKRCAFFPAPQLNLQGHPPGLQALG
jgi:hypothetical protein